MKTAIRLMAVATGLLAAHVAVAQAPAGSTGQCKDGTYSTAASKQGACRGHQGVKEWYAAAGAPAAASAPAAAAAAPKSAAAAPPAAGPKPANATGQCNDGTYATSTSKSAGCRGHQGVKEWYAAAAAPAATAPAPAAPTAPAKTAAAPMPAAAPAAPAASTKASPSAKAAAMTQAAGGGPGMVWVNTESNVYHCYGTTYYGKTKAGAYMSEADAKAKGAHADHGHACSK
jgi:hypothetical protein